jgi:hypothetical protein
MGIPYIYPYLFYLYYITLMHYQAKVALEALKGLKTVNQIASETLITSDTGHTLEEATVRSDSKYICHRPRSKAKKPRGYNRLVISADRSTQSGVGLGEKKAGITN